ncbi:MAG: Gamma-glutamylputrescine oxidoreductase [Gammaproteobacteria bacterium]|nr:Gamma-glutamylputrescine oxidoreductase [Gammaproteobacteria bacterium]
MDETWRKPLHIETMTKVQHVDSYYAASANHAPDYSELRGDRTADVCIIGAGLTGASCALELAARGYRVIVLEANRVGWGASGRSGGQMIFGYGCGEDVLEKLTGAADARKLWDMSLEAIELIRERVHQHDIACDLVQGQLHAALKPRQMRGLEAWRDTLESGYGYHGPQLWGRDKVRSLLATERYIGGLFDSNSGHLHPLNYTLGLVNAAHEAGAEFYESSRAVDISTGPRKTVTTEKGAVHCRYVVLGGNAYLGGLCAPIAARIMPVGTYIGATEPLGKERAQALIPGNIAVTDVDFVLDYFRMSADHRLLFGGRVSYSKVAPPNLPLALKRRMLNVFPQLRDVGMDYTWGGYVAITRNRAPDLGRLDDNIFYAQGFSGHGIALTGLAGKLIAEAVSGTAERFDVFTRIPHRNFPGGTLLRTPALVLAMFWYRLRDLL